MAINEFGVTGEARVADVWFTVSGPLSWENDAVVARVLKKLAGTYGSGRLGMVVGDQVGLDKIAEAQARSIGIHCVVVPTLHNTYYRAAPRLALLTKMAVLNAMYMRSHSGKGNFLLAFYWDLQTNLDVRNAMVVARRDGVRLVPVKVGKNVGMSAGEAWYKMKADKQRASRKKTR